MNQRVKAATSERVAGPFLKWAGGKSSLLGQFARLLPPSGSYKRYFEPFLGGGAVFFFLQPEHSYLTDLNHELIEVYCMVRDNVESLIEALRGHYNDHDYFYRVRAWSPADLTPVERAARFIFLNRTCYNGLYRVNRAGQFNVPFGRYTNPTICDEPTLRAASAALQNAHLAELDFERASEHAQPGDLIYFDPPYHPLSQTSSFTGYTSNGFGAGEQMRLAELFRHLDRRGCRLMLSNSTAPLIRQLYDDFHIHEIDARRAINSKGDGRGVIKEYLITNFDWYCKDEGYTLTAGAIAVLSEPPQTQARALARAVVNSWVFRELIGRAQADGKFTVDDINRVIGSAKRPDGQPHYSGSTVPRRQRTIVGWLRWLEQEIGCFKSSAGEFFLA